MYFSVHYSEVVDVCGGFNTDHSKVYQKHLQRAHIRVTLVDNVQALAEFFWIAEIKSAKVSRKLKLRIDNHHALTRLHKQVLVLVRLVQVRLVRVRPVRDNLARAKPVPDSLARVRLVQVKLVLDS